MIKDGQMLGLALWTDVATSKFLSPVHVTEIPWVDESSERELLSLLGDWYEPDMFNSVFSSSASDAVTFTF